MGSKGRTMPWISWTSNIGKKHVEVALLVNYQEVMGCHFSTGIHQGAQAKSNRYSVYGKWRMSTVGLMQERNKLKVKLAISTIRSRPAIGVMDPVVQMNWAGANIRSKYSHLQFSGLSL